MNFKQPQSNTDEGSSTGRSNVFEDASNDVTIKDEISDVAIKDEISDVAIKDEISDVAFSAEEESSMDIVDIRQIEPSPGHARAKDFFEIVSANQGQCLLCHKTIRLKKYNMEMHLQHRHPQVFQTLDCTIVKKRKSSSLPSPCINIAVGMETPRLDQKTTDALCTWLCADLVPPDRLQSVYFHRFMAALNKNYEVPSSKLITKAVLPEFQKKVLMQVKRDWSTTFPGNAVSISLDTWKCTAQEISCVLLMAHFIDKDWQQRSYCLGVTPIDRRHPQYTISSKIKEDLRAFNIHDVNSAVRDTVAYSRNACDQLNTVHYPCILQQLQSLLGGLSKMDDSAPSGTAVQQNAAEQASIRMYLELIGKIRRIAALLKESPSLWEGYQQVWKSVHRLAVKDVPVDVPGRWNSTIAMLEGIAAQVTVLRMASSHLALNCEDLLVSDMENVHLTDFLCLFEPFQEAVSVLGSKPFQLASMIIPVIVGIPSRLKEIRSDALDKQKPDLFNLCTFLMDRMATMVTDYQKNINLQKATFLDPRFKGFCLSHEEEDAVVQKITDEMDVLLHSNADAQAEGRQHTRSIFGSLFKNQSEKAVSVDTESLDYQELHTMVRAYGKHGRLPMDTDVLMYWKVKEQEKSMSILPCIARKYLGFVANASHSKYALTEEGELTIEKCKAISSAKAMEALLFCNQNISLL